MSGCRPADRGSCRAAPRHRPGGAGHGRRIANVEFLQRAFDLVGVQAQLGRGGAWRGEPEIVPAVAAAIGGLEADVAAGRALHRTGLIVSAEDGSAGVSNARWMSASTRSASARLASASGIVPSRRTASPACPVSKSVARARQRRRRWRAPSAADRPDWQRDDSALAAGTPQRQLADGARDPDRPGNRASPRRRARPRAAQRRRARRAGNGSAPDDIGRQQFAAGASAGTLAPDSRSSRPRYASATSVGAPCSTAAVSRRRAATT